jgi:anaerobic ribonucleoside-triphosphate reductase
MIIAKGSSPNELMDEMQDALSDLGKDIETYSKQLEKLIGADNTYKETYATTYLNTKASGEKMTVTEIDCKVTEKLSELKRAADISEALVKSTREHMDWERRRIEVAQSILAFSRSELEHTMNAEPPVHIQPFYREARGL